MRKKKITGIAAFILVVITLLVFTGCPLHMDALYGPKLVGDGNGNTIAIYEDKLGGNIYAQKISAEGKAGWGEKGVLLGASSREVYSFFHFDIVGDGAGGAIVAWPESNEQMRPVKHLARIDAGGKILWQHDLVSFNQLIGDGSGGCLIAYDNEIVDIVNDEIQDLTIVKINAQGEYTWTTRGITVSRQNYWPNSLHLTSDGSGGAIALWEERRGGSTHLVAQKVDAGGKMPWGEDNLLLVTNSQDIDIDEPVAVADGSGGAIFAWHRAPEGKMESGTPEWLLQDICAQKIDAAGNLLWQGGGVPLEIVKNAEMAFVHSPMLVNDGSGGAIVLWEDLRYGLASFYAQRLDSAGAIKWQAGGVKVCYIDSDASLFPRQAVSDDPGGVLFTCRFRDAGTGQRGILVQRIDSEGRAVWPGNGVTVTDGETSGHFIASDGQGGVVTGWGVSKGTFSSEKSYVQRIGADGGLRWGEEGLRLNP